MECSQSFLVQPGRFPMLIDIAAVVASLAVLAGLCWALYGWFRLSIHRFNGVIAKDVLAAWDAEMAKPSVDDRERLRTQAPGRSPGSGFPRAQRPKSRAGSADVRVGRACLAPAFGARGGATVHGGFACSDTSDDPPCRFGRHRGDLRGDTAPRGENVVTDPASGVLRRSGCQRASGRPAWTFVTSLRRESRCSTQQCCLPCWTEPTGWYGSTYRFGMSRPNRR